MEEQKGGARIEPVISDKIFLMPSKEEIKKYADKNKLLIKKILLSTSILFVGFLMIASIVAMFIVHNFSLSNLTIVITLALIEGYIILELRKHLKEKLFAIKGEVVDIKDVTSTYEEISKDKNKEFKKKIEITYEFQDPKGHDYQNKFVILLNKEKELELQSEIPDFGNEIPIIYDLKKSKVIGIFIPKLEDYIENI